MTTQKGPQEQLLGNESRDIPVIRKMEALHVLAKPVLSCADGASMKPLVDLVVDSRSHHAEMNAHVENNDFSLFKGMYEVTAAESPTIELEHTKGTYRQGVLTKTFSPAEQLSKIHAAGRRLEEMQNLLLPCGFLIYAITLLGGFSAGAVCDCAVGPGPQMFGFPAVAIGIQLYFLNKLTILLSQTNIEGRPLLRLLVSMGPFKTDDWAKLDKKTAWNYRYMTFMAALDVMSRYTRARFVGYLYKCGSPVQESSDAYFAHYPPSDPLSWMIANYPLGLVGFATASFIVGPFIIQGGYALHLHHKLKKNLATAKTRQAGENMGITHVLDDMGALMKWASLGPAASVFELASIPCNSDDDGSAARLWDRMKTQVIVTVVRDIPDGINQVVVQTLFIALTYNNLSLGGKGMMFLNIILAAAMVYGDGMDLIKQNRRLTVAVGLPMVIYLISPLVTVIGLFACQSSMLASSRGVITCVPQGLIPPGNWPAGVFPG